MDDILMTGAEGAEGSASGSVPDAAAASQEAAGGDGQAAGVAPVPPQGAAAAPPQAADSAAVVVDVHGNFVGKGWAGEDVKLAEKFTSIGALAKSYRNLEQMLARQDRVAVPTEGASEEERAAFYEKLGRPRSPEDYELEVPEALRDYEHLRNEEQLGEFRKVAHEAGLTAAQTKAVAQMHYNQVQAALEQMHEQQQERRSQAVQELAKGWGTSADSAAFKEHIALARAGARALGIDEATLAASPELTNNPHFIRAMHRAAQMTAEAPAVAAREGAGPIGEDIQKQIDAIMKNPDSPYWKRGHPAHRQVVQELTALFEKKAST